MINDVINKIADDLLALAHSILEDDGVSTNTKIHENTLRDSVLNEDLYAGISQQIGGDPVISAFFNHYVVYLEWDRPPMYGKQPPISALKDWAAKAGLGTDAETLHAIAYAIWRDGHVGRPIFATLDKEIDLQYSKVWADELYNAIVYELDQLFND